MAANTAERVDSGPIRNLFYKLRLQQHNHLAVVRSVDHTLPDLLLLHQEGLIVC